jgi:tetratricopeptide (TPR) repeat protein/transcriptional regulator with XRE-family HTH domain
VTEQSALGFAGLLRLLRAEARLTQEELASAAGVSTRAVSDLERGLHQKAHKDTAAMLADALTLPAAARALFVAAARGHVPAAEVLAARAHAAATAHEPPRPAGVATSADTAGGGPAASGPAGQPVPHELPADVGAFTGRAAELADLDRLRPAAAGDEPGHAQGPMVIWVLSGTAGVGKTALAVRWAHRVAGLFPDGQLYVNLRGYDPDQPVTAANALAGFLRAVGTASQDIPLPVAERAARYRSAVAGRRMLVVLDNAATVEQVRPLLPGTATAQVIVTSRDSLPGLVALDGASRLDLDLLPPADAVALLRTLIGGRADADRAAAQTLAAQCARLPLALRIAAELAAARLDTPLAKMTVELGTLRDRLSVLTAGGDPRGAVASVFSWSCRHLPPEAARMFRRLGLHPGPDWDRHAAAALTGMTTAQAGRSLAVLARAHLIQPAPAGRYGMHDLLRAYAAGLAATDDSEQARRSALTSLFDYYLGACAAALDLLAPAERQHRPAPAAAATPGPEFETQAAARAWLDEELPTLTAVVAHTARHGWPGHATRLAATLKRYLYGGHDTEALSINVHALGAARDCGDRVAEAGTLISLGVFHARQGRGDQAADCQRQALALARDIGDRVAQASALSGLAFVHDWQHRHGQAADCQRQALALYRELGDRAGQVAAMQSLGVSYFRQGRYRQADGHLRQALALSREIGDPHGEAWALASLGDMCYQRSLYPDAIGYLRQALTAARQIGDRYVEAEALTRLGEVCHRQGHRDQAAGYCQEALTLFREIGDRGGEADALNGAGQALLAAGEPGEAAACHTAALTLARQAGHRYQQARALARLGQARRLQGELDQAAACQREAAALFGEIGDRGGEADALNGAGETALAAGQPAKARDHHAAALAAARRVGDRYQQARAHQGQAEACRATGHPGQARQHRQIAAAVYTDLGVPEAGQTLTGPAPVPVPVSVPAPD